MPLPRTVADSEKMMRSAAVARLRDCGVVLNTHRRHPQGIADAIRMLCPQYEDTGNPMSIIRAWLGDRPDGTVRANEIVSTGRPYVMSAALRAAAERAAVQPPLQALVSRVPPTREYERLA